MSKSWLRTLVLLELAPGHGRLTPYLIQHCQELTLVDVTESCIEACRLRFGDRNGIHFLVNDGKSLSGVPDRSIDLVFSYDSLVHAESDAVGGYVSELDRILSNQGVAFLHHSNLGALKNDDGSLAVENRHWRSDSVSAEAVRKWAEEQENLCCFAQELINWGGGPELTDCFSALCRSDDRRATQPFTSHENPRFIESGLELASASSLFSGEP